MNPVQAKLKARGDRAAAVGRKVAAVAVKAKPAPKKVGPAPSKALGPPAPGGGQQGPRLNINYKDLDPDEQAQAAKKAGLNPGPGSLPPGVEKPGDQQLAAAANAQMPPPVETGENPKEEAGETPDEEKAEEDQSKSDLAPPPGHHAVVAHVRKNPVVSKVYAEKLKKRGVPVK